MSYIKQALQEYEDTIKDLLEVKFLLMTTIKPQTLLIQNIIDKVSNIIDKLTEEYTNETI
jgi:hypothetical protein